MPFKSPEARSAYQAMYRQLPHAKKARKLLESDRNYKEERRLYMAKYSKSPRGIAVRVKWLEENKRDPDRLKRRKIYVSQYRGNPKNLEKISHQMARYYRNPVVKKRVLDYQKIYCKKRLASDPWFLCRRRLHSRLLCAIRSNGAKKSKSTMMLVGCDASHLKQHIERQFQIGMSWENRNLWHIDHIIPCAEFDLTDSSQQDACFHYTNLQPLWAIDNLKKNKKLTTPKNA